MGNTKGEYEQECDCPHSLPAAATATTYKSWDTSISPVIPTSTRNKIAKLLSHVSYTKQHVSPSQAMERTSDSFRVTLNFLVQGLLRNL